MERRSFVQGAGMAGVLAAGVAPAIVHAQANIRWRLASSFPKSLDTIFGAAEVFSKKISDMTGGKFQITVHAAGELMPAFGVVDGVQGATVEVAHTAPYYFFGKDPTFALACALPFGMNVRQQNAWMYHGGGLQLMREFFKDYNIINFPAGNTGAQMGGWFRKEIKSPDDFTAREHLDLELVVGRGRDALADRLRRAENRVQALREARRQPPFHFGGRLREYRRGRSRQDAGQAGVLDERTTLHPMSPRFLFDDSPACRRRFRPGPQARFHLVRGPAPDDPLAGQSGILAAGQHPVIARETDVSGRRTHEIANGTYGASLRTALKRVHVQPVCRSRVCVKRIR